MTCPYFSMRNGKVFCNVYGLIEANQEKIQECHESYYVCFEEANVRLREEQDKARDEMVISAERRSRSIMEGEDIEDIPSEF